jgi:hypothetical protein
MNLPISSKKIEKEKKKKKKKKKKIRNEEIKKQ